jgi:hypothetical protein
MDIRVVTLRYSDGVQGFPEEALLKAVSGREVLEAREHVGVLPEDNVRIAPEVWAQLAGFVERREAIRAEYQNFNGRVSIHELHPYHLLYCPNSWCGR